MGSITMSNTRKRVDEAIRQRLRANGVSEEEANREIFWEAINELEKIAVDEAELDRVARELAVKPEKVESDFVRVNDEGQPKIMVHRIASEVADEIARSLDLPEGDFVEIREEIESRLGGEPLPLSTERVWLFGREG